MYCKHCANEIDEDVIICPKCGKQVQELKREDSLNRIIEDKNAWYFQTWFIVLMFFVFFPIAIVLLILKYAK